jgi:hypothetical protein
MAAWSNLAHCRECASPVAPKLAVLMHKLWRSGQVFDWNRGMEVAQTH